MMNSATGDEPFLLREAPVLPCPDDARPKREWHIVPPARRVAVVRRILGHRSSRAVLRFIAIVSLDFAAIAATMAMVLALTDRDEIGTPVFRAAFLFLFATIATSVFVLSGLYRRSWRFLTFADCVFLGRTILLGLATAWIAAMAVPGYRLLGEHIVALAVLHGSALAVLMGSMRVVRRFLRERRSSGVAMHSAAADGAARRLVLLVGPPEWASSVIELVRRDPSSQMDVAGILLPAAGDPISRLSGVPVLGGPEMLVGALDMLEDRGRKPDSLILCDDDHSMAFADRSRLIGRAHDMGLQIGRVADPCRQLLRTSPRIDIEGLPVAELLGRPESKMERRLVAEVIRGSRVLVTGAGGTIGGELVKQLAGFDPSEIVLLDHAEHSLYTIEMEVRDRFPGVTFHQALCSIRQRQSVRAVFERFRPEYVFHAAALKHVPIVEANPCAGVHTNVVGTRNVADAVCEFGAVAMVQVSTDKAVNPVGMMGATKRLGELYCQALDLCGTDDADAPRFITVRFGNVLGSSGSIVPLFKRQIADGGPLTVTHPDITRFFMTVKEAVQLILQSSAAAVKTDADRGNIYVLDMGEPVRIVDMARQMILLAGLEPEVDIDIRFVGLRPGEKLYEELFDSCEDRLGSTITGIFEAHSRPIPLPLIARAIARLEHLVAEGDDDEVCRITHNLVKLPNGSADISVPFGDIASRMAAIDQERRMVQW
ncbi:polysaccharide biosynthesis protein [Stakelama saccharophila]|uniref:Polysaccharide biosynthesis protein n=1 Tax=Stakelama saccharophila TaxID=3075605 RepID=A0ABZ0BAY6_9SPHN|nr:polysaccharide biosynthesis protein [Stakelama sp. W311]WNO54220.1 polysaccharide biosynthesis protein [Stakelama sp. W311]